VHDLEWLGHGHVHVGNPVILMTACGRLPFSDAANAVSRLTPMSTRSHRVGHLSHPHPDTVGKFVAVSSPAGCGRRRVAVAQHVACAVAACCSQRVASARCWAGWTGGIARRSPRGALDLQQGAPDAIGAAAAHPDCRISRLLKRNSERPPHKRILTPRMAERTVLRWAGVHHGVGR
jgi:hypothetical protein